MVNENQTDETPVDLFRRMSNVEQTPLNGNSRFLVLKIEEAVRN